MTSKQFEAIADALLLLDADLTKTNYLLGLLVSDMRKTDPEDINAVLVYNQEILRMTRLVNQEIKDAKENTKND